MVDTNIRGRIETMPTYADFLPVLSQVALQTDTHTQFLGGIAESDNATYR